MPSILIEVVLMKRKDFFWKCNIRKKWNKNNSRKR